MAEENVNAQNIEVSPEQVAEPDVNRSAADAGSEESSAGASSANESAGRMSDIETTLKTLTESLAGISAQISTLMEEKEKRDKVNSGFFKPMKEVPDDTPKSVNDIFAPTRKYKGV